MREEEEALPNAHWCTMLACIQEADICLVRHWFPIRNLIWCNMTFCLGPPAIHMLVPALGILPGLLWISYQDAIVSLALCTSALFPLWMLFHSMRVLQRVIWFYWHWHKISLHILDGSLLIMCSLWVWCCEKKGQLKLCDEAVTLINRAEQSNAGSSSPHKFATDRGWRSCNMMPFCSEAFKYV